MAHHHHHHQHHLEDNTYIHFSADDKNELMQRFPALELSYETVLHRKVDGDIFVLVPMGTKAFVWYTYWRHRNVCVLLPLNERNNVNMAKIQIMPACFTQDLAYGTVLYGTYFYNSNTNLKQPYFACSNIYHFCGKFVGHWPYSQKLECLSTLCRQHIKAVSYSTRFLVVGLPIMKTSFDDSDSDAGYKVYGIQVYKSQQVHSLGVISLKQLLHLKSVPAAPVTLPIKQNNVNGEKATTIENASSKAVYDVQAGVDADIYYLYKVGTDEQVATAIIPTYKASVMMNSLFRNIKENRRLDLLEESDDDDEFENIQDDKFVDCTKRIRMTCVYLRQFRKWQPVAVAVAVALDNTIFT